MEPFVQELLYWVPLFDEYRVQIAFENHVHELKRTVPLYGNEETDPNKGTVYLGDGAWGVDMFSCADEGGKANMPNFMAKNSSDNNVWKMTITATQNIFTALGTSGTTLDEIKVDNAYYLHQD